MGLPVGHGVSFGELTTLTTETTEITEKCCIFASVHSV